MKGKVEEGGQEKWVIFMVKVILDGKVLNI